MNIMHECVFCAECIKFTLILEGNVAHVALSFDILQHTKNTTKSYVHQEPNLTTSGAK